MAAVTIHSGFGAQENKIRHCLHFFPHLFAMMGPNAKILVVLMLSLKPVGISILLQMVAWSGRR